MTKPRKSLELKVATGEPWEGARHFSGRRRNGLPAPDCPVCKVPMFCIFSLDGTDEVLDGTPLEVAELDYDLFVCGQLCYPYQTGYFTRVLSDGSVKIIFMYEGPDDNTREILQPYPVAPLKLEVLANQAAPVGEEIWEYYSRAIPPGYYHRIAPYFLWGEEGQRGLHITKDCPFCGTSMEKAMIIDSDENLGINEKLGIDWESAGPTALIWGDLNYLGVTVCSNCKAFGYRLMM